MHQPLAAVFPGLLLATLVSAQGQAKVLAEHHTNGHTDAAFHFTRIASPSATDAATNATFQLVAGKRDGNGAELAALHDGKTPSAEDAPRDNFFLAGHDGGRIVIDLGKAIDVAMVNTYSWHPGPRGPQVYRLFAADGTANGFDAAPKSGADPRQCGWQFVAAVDTRPKILGPGGQHAVCIADPAGSLGSYRYVMLDIEPTDRDDGSSQTFWSEIDVVAMAAQASPFVAHTQDGHFEISIDAAAAPGLQPWAQNELLPVMLAWYPKIVAMLRSEDFVAPDKLSLTIESPGHGVAATGGTHISCAAAWLFDNLDGEAKGAIVHELVHVAQQYGHLRGGRRRARAPGWLTEGIADYVRWFLYEPESHGADFAGDPAKAKYDGGYRISANFLNWVESHHQGSVQRINAALRESSYADSLWQDITGKPLLALGSEWRDQLATAGKAPEPAAAPTGAGENTLSEAERQAGWRLLWNGKDFTGWHSYHHEDVLPGWQIKDGAITCADPHNAGDLCTNERFGAFELMIDYNISRGGNSGIMFHVDNQGGATWASGPECQLLDNKEGKDPQRAGWLYGLYNTEVDATHPAGEWNHLRLLITPEKCEHEMNGVKYFEYVLHSPDFEARVAKSKFASMPKFAKSDSGFLALQGDHGLISFRNLKIRPIAAK